MKLGCLAEVRACGSERELDRKSMHALFHMSTADHVLDSPLNNVICDGLGMT